MRRVVRLILALKKIDRIVFGNCLRVKFCLRGTAHHIITVSNEGGEVIAEYYLIAITYLFKRFDPIRVAIHEVRHRAQKNVPGLQFFNLEDVPEEMRPHINLDLVDRIPLNEIDAQLFDELAYPLYCSGDIKGFLHLMFRGTQREGSQ